jgi:hypothetical protein
MTTPETICGHQTKVLRWALTRQEPKPNTGIHVSGAPNHWWLLYRTITTDETKLAEIITELVRLLGYKVGDLSDLLADVHVWSFSELDAPPWPKCIHIATNMGANNRTCHSLTMPEARVMALYLLDVVEAEAERENGRVELFVVVERRVGGQFELLIRALERAKIIAVGT